MLTAWRPLEGEPFQLMQKLAREYEGVVGGSFIARSGDDCFNSFLLVFPSGEYFRHDKDIPTMWENCYYIGGQDEGVLKTPAGPVGVAICWEFIRSQTARRLQNRVDLIVGGSCWWDLRLPVDAKYEADRTQLHNFLKRLHHGSLEWLEHLLFTLLMLVILKGLFLARKAEGIAQDILARRRLSTVLARCSRA